MAQTRSDRDQDAAKLSKAELRHQLSVMTAPEDATVLDVAQRPAGSVMREAETLMRLVPADRPLLAEVQIDTRDVARLHLGDPVTIKFEALPWQQYGLAHGALQSLTPDTLEDDSARETAEDMTEPGMKKQAAEPDPLPRPHCDHRHEVPEFAGGFRDPPRHALDRRHQNRPSLGARIRAQPDHQGHRREFAETLNPNSKSRSSQEQLIDRTSDFPDKHQEKRRS